LFIQRKLNWIQFNELSNWFHFLIEKKPTKKKTTKMTVQRSQQILNHIRAIILRLTESLYMWNVWGGHLLHHHVKTVNLNAILFLKYSMTRLLPVLYMLCIYITTSLFVRICGHLVLFEIYREYVRSEYSLILTSVTLL